MKQGDSYVREYNSSFLAAGLLDNHDQRMLVNMYRDGLKEDIRVALGSMEFSTIDDIMQTALDIEEGESESESDSAVDLRDYQEYLKNNHLSCSESSEESD
ncbi:hypothetical protein Bca101_042853 [Brassica carinata]